MWAHPSHFGLWEKALHQPPSSLQSADALPFLDAPQTGSAVSVHLLELETENHWAQRTLFKKKRRLLPFMEAPLCWETFLLERVVALNELFKISTVLFSVPSHVSLHIFGGSPSEFSASVWLTLHSLYFCPDFLSSNLGSILAPTFMTLRNFQSTVLNYT